MRSKLSDRIPMVLTTVGLWSFALLQGWWAAWELTGNLLVLMSPPWIDPQSITDGILYVAGPLVVTEPFVNYVDSNLTSEWRLITLFVTSAWLAIAASAFLFIGYLVNWWQSPSSLQRWRKAVMWISATPGAVVGITFLVLFALVAVTMLVVCIVGVILSVGVVMAMGAAAQQELERVEVDGISKGLVGDIVDELQPRL